MAGSVVGLAAVFSVEDGGGVFDGVVVFGDEGDFGDGFVAPVVFADGGWPDFAVYGEVEDLEEVADAAGEDRECGGDGVGGVAKGAFVGIYDFEGGKVSAGEGGWVVEVEFGPDCCGEWAGGWG